MACLCWAQLYMEDLVQEAGSQLQRSYAQGREVKGRSIKTSLGRSDLSKDNTQDCLENWNNFLAFCTVVSQACGPAGWLPKR